MVSVIIPTFNRRSIISYTLDSVQQMHHEGIAIEVVVVDDGSTDDTVAYVQDNYPWVIVLKNKGKGAPSARNEGLRAATGKYIVYLDSDDLIGPDFFKKKVALLDTDSALTACYGEYDFFKSDGAYHENTVMFKHKYPMLDKSAGSKAHMVEYLRGNFLPPNAIVWRRDFLLTIGGHDESLPINQDVELVFRALFKGAIIAGLSDGTKVCIRSHALDNRVGATNSPEKLESMLTLRQKIYKQLQESAAFNDKECYKALSTYVFNLWKGLRHANKELAERFLKLSQQVYWPVEIKGNLVFRLIAKVFGPVAAVNIKYLIYKRD